MAVRSKATTTDASLRRRVGQQRPRSSSPYLSSSYYPPTILFRQPGVVKMYASSSSTSSQTVQLIEACLRETEACVAHVRSPPGLVSVAAGIRHELLRSEAD